MQSTNTSPTPDLHAIAARANAATPGPWEITDRNGDHVRRKLRGADDRMVLGISALLWPDPADEAFLTHAREDIPALLDALAAVIAERDQARQMLADAEQKIASMELDASLREEDERFADPL